MASIEQNCQELGIKISSEQRRTLLAKVEELGDQKVPTGLGSLVAMSKEVDRLVHRPVLLVVNRALSAAKLFNFAMVLRDYGTEFTACHGQVVLGRFEVVLTPLTSVPQFFHVVDGGLGGQLPGDAVLKIAQFLGAILPDFRGLERARSCQLRC
jgi:hypothetical protein